MLKKRKTPAEEPEQGIVTFDAPSIGVNDHTESTDTIPSDSEGTVSPKNESDDSDNSNYPDHSDKKETDSAGKTSEENSGEATADPEPFDDSEIREAFQAWLDARKLTPEQRESICGAFRILIDAFARGAADEALFELIALGADYDRAVAEAEKAGEIAGRNASIDQLMGAAPGDDGVPHPGVSSGPVRKQNPSIFDIARTVY